MIRPFVPSDSGATAMIYALCLLPLMAGIGFAVDTTRAVSAKTAMQASLDAAVLASTRDVADASLSDAEVISRAQAYFMADVSQGYTGVQCAPADVLLDRADFKIEVSAECTLPTTIAGLMGIENFEMSESSNAKITVTKLDLALMLDVSGSMSGTKLEALKSAATEAIDELITPETGTRVRIALAPYAESVNVGSYGGDVFAAGFSTEVCASERVGAQSATDAIPATGQWIETVATTCPSNSILPLTHRIDDLEDAIDNLSAGGGTAGHLGVAWARYLISPEWTPVWPSASAPRADDAPAVVKAMILMTDGAFNTVYDPLLGDSDTQAKALCDEIKNDGVLVFAVAFQAPTKGEAILKECASSPDKYFDAGSMAELREAYKSIASSLSDLRLTN